MSVHCIVARSNSYKSLRNDTANIPTSLGKCKHPDLIKKSVSRAFSQPLLLRRTGTSIFSKREGRAKLPKKSQSQAHLRKKSVSTGSTAEPLPTTALFARASQSKAAQQPIGAVGRAALCASHPAARGPRSRQRRRACCRLPRARAPREGLGLRRTSSLPTLGRPGPARKNHLPPLPRQ